MPVQAQEPMRYIGIRVEQADLDRLEALAQETCRTKSQLVRLLIRKAITANRPLDVALAAEDARHDDAAVVG